MPLPRATVIVLSLHIWKASDAFPLCGVGLLKRKKPEVGQFASHGPQMNDYPGADRLFLVTKIERFDRNCLAGVVQFHHI